MVQSGKNRDKKDRCRTAFLEGFTRRERSHRKSMGDTRMKTRSAATLAAVIGFGLGAVSIGVLHAQGKPPVYAVVEIDMKNADVFQKEYVPKAQAVTKAAGGRVLAAGKASSVEGAAPKSRVAIQQWDTMEQYQAYRNSKEFKELRKTGDTLATFRSFVVEGAAR